MLRQPRLIVLDFFAVNVFLAGISPHIGLVSIRIHVHLRFLDVHVRLNVHVDIHACVRLSIHIDLNSRRLLLLRRPISLFLRNIARRLRRKQKQRHPGHQHRKKICPVHTPLLNSAC